MQINCYWSGEGFKPMYPSGKEKANNFKKGRVYMIEVPDRPERNTKLHNKLFAIERMMVENLDEYHPIANTFREKEAARERLHRDLMLLINHTITTVIDGQSVLQPASISFKNLDDESFAVKVYIPVRRIAAQMLGCTEDDIENNVVSYS